MLTAIYFTGATVALAMALFTSRPKDWADGLAILLYSLLWFVTLPATGVQIVRIVRTGREE